MTSLVGVSARSDTGAVRHVNEDSLLVQDPVFVVADGMGGHARGDLASSTAVQSLAAALPPGSRPTPEEVVAAIDEANAAVRGLSSADESGSAVAGTTLSGLVRVHVPELGEERWLSLNVGDSRVYCWDEDGLHQLTVDHSAVQELVDAGLITRVQAEKHPERNVITRALGAEDFVDTDAEVLPEQPDATYLICSDGLTRELNDSQIATILAQGHDDPAAVLVQAAVDAGGHDNITVIVLEAVLDEEGFDETQPRPDTERA